MHDHEVEILLAEDDDADLELTLQVLRSENLGNKIFVARDGEEALEFLQRSLADGALPSVLRLVLLDLKMPKVDGLTVLREIKKDPRLKLIPVVVLTSSSRDRDLVDSYNLGVNSFIQKPADFDQFRTVVKELGYYWLLVNRAPMVVEEAAPPAAA
jgi:two-component system response regulator